MMMPANFSVVAENEMTYVIGGGLVDALPSVMGEAQWKTFGTNLINIIGNTYVSKFVNATLGQMFNGNYCFGNVTSYICSEMQKMLTSTATTAGSAAANGKWTGHGILNAGLAVVGGLAAIYQLGYTSVATYTGNKKFINVTVQ
jgi:hypothetical protein